MTASLYQNASDIAGRGREGRGELHVKNMRDAILRIEADVVPFTAPEIALGREQIDDFDGRVRRQSPRDGRQLHESVLHVCGIEVDNDEDQIAAVAGSLGIGEKFAVVGMMKRQPPVAVQGRMRSSDGVDLADELGETVGACEV